MYLIKNCKDVKCQYFNPSSHIITVLLITKTHKHFSWLLCHLNFIQIQTKTEAQERLKNLRTQNKSVAELGDL